MQQVKQPSCRPKKEAIYFIYLFVKCLLIKWTLALLIESKVTSSCRDFGLAPKTPLDWNSSRIHVFSCHNLYLTLLQSIPSALWRHGRTGAWLLSYRRSGDNKLIHPNLQRGPAVQATATASRMWTQMRGRMDEQDFVLTEPWGRRGAVLRQDVLSDLLNRPCWKNTAVSLKWLHVGRFCYGCFKSNTLRP